jgi:hypothetical protein
MPYIANKPDDYFDISVGDGHCVAFVRAASPAPISSMWTRGESVKTANLVRGTVIATFDSNGKYGSRKDGSCHAAIFLRKTSAGIVVLDQWITSSGARKVVSERTIRFNNSNGLKVNNGDNYYVVN